MSKTSVRLFIVLLVVSALLAACTPPEPEIVEVEVIKEVEVEVEVTRVVEVEVEVVVTPDAPVYFEETAVQNIALAGELADRHAEISGMAWYGETLILMPQYPNFYLEEGTEDNGSVFAIAKADIDAYLNGESFAPIEATKIPFSAPEAYAIEGFEGFESIVFEDDNVYMTIEVEGAEGMYAYIIAGAIAPDLSGLTLDTATMTQIATQSGVENMSDEVMLLAEGNLVTIHEANGVAVNATPIAHVFHTDLSEAGTITLGNVEYRVTDASALDENNNFWMINYFYPGEEILMPEIDPIAAMYGEGPTHTAAAGVERLVEFSYSADGIAMTDTAPIMMQLMADGNLRNFEGLVRYEAAFLLATDKYPFTILGFVPLPEIEE